MLTCFNQDPTKDEGLRELSDCLVTNAYQTVYNVEPSNFILTLAFLVQSLVYTVLFILLLSLLHKWGNKLADNYVAKHYPDHEKRTSTHKDETKQ